MSNIFIERDFTVEQLEDLKIKSNKRLQEVGELYNGKWDNLSEYQEYARKMHHDGYNYDNQIYHLYAEIGAINEALEHADEY